VNDWSSSILFNCSLLTVDEVADFWEEHAEKTSTTRMSVNSFCITGVLNND
jgi:hypothetical protein